MDEQPLDDLLTFVETCTQSVDGASLSVALDHLQSGKIPAARSSTQADVGAIKLAIGSLRVLQPLMITSAFCKNESGGPGVTPGLVHAAWQDIWRWIVFLHTKCIIQQSHGETIMRASLHTIPYTLTSFGWYAGLRVSMIKTPGLISMLTWHWLKEEAYIEQFGLAWDQRHFALALEQLLTYGNDAQNPTDKEVVIAMVQAAEGGAATVTQVALQQFGTVLLSQTQDLDVISLVLTLIHELSDSLLHPSLLRQGSIPLLISLLMKFPPLLSNEVISPALDRCILMGSVNLVSFIQTVNGPSFVVQALNRGLLAAFLRAWPCICTSFELGSTLSTGLFSVLRDYLVYRSVLRAVAKALKVVKHMDVLVPDCEPWVTFQETASLRLHFKDKFDMQSESRLDPGFCGCANTDCRLRSDNIEYKLCSGCCGEVYCSSNCQRAHWSKHRILCKMWQKSLRDGSSIPISQHDRNFLHYIATHDFHNNIHALRTTIKDKYPSALASSLCIQISYLGPASMGVSLFASLSWQDADEKSEMDALVHQAQATEGRHILAQVTVRNGCDPKLGVILRTFPLLVPLPPHWLDD